VSDTPSVLVTGAGQGLGYELCRIYLGMGWRVFPLVRSMPGAARFDPAVARSCHPIIVDLVSEDPVGAIRAAVSAQTERLDVVINNAGVPGAATKLAALTPHELGQLLDVHCLGAILCTQAVLPLLRARGSKIVNVTSRTASFAGNAAGEFAGESISYSYRIAKAAQNMLTLCMSDELGRAGVVVCAVHPGEFESALNPDGAEPAAEAAARMVSFIEGLGPDDHGLWHDPRVGQIPW